MIEDLFDALRHAADLPEEQLADALLLAARSAAPGPPAAPARSHPAEQTSPSLVGADRSEDDLCEDEDDGRRIDISGPDLILAPEDEQGYDEAVPASPGAELLGLRVRRPRPAAIPATFAPFRKVTRPGAPTVDVDATIEATAAAGRLIVVTKPVADRGLDVILLVDRTPATAAWEPQIAELRRHLTHSGAFRSVTRLSLDAGDGHGPRVGKPGRPAEPPRRIVDPTGRTLLLIVTDAVSDHWYAPPIWQTVRDWARHMPTSIVQVLPPRQWVSTAVGNPTAQIRSHLRAGTASRVEVRTAWWARDAKTGAVPIVHLESGELERWARALTVAAPWADAVAVGPPEASRPAVRNEGLGTAERVQAFHLRATAGAQVLARLAAHGELLSLALVRVLQEELVPDAGPTAIAELLVSGLLERDDPAADTFRFRAGVAEVLRRNGTLDEDWDTFEVLTDHLARYAATGPDLRVLLADGLGDAMLEPGLRPFAAMTRELGGRLGLGPPITAEPAEHRSGETDVEREIAPVLVVPDSVSTVETATGTSPTAARRHVRLALRQAREAAGITQLEVAEHLEWSLSKIIRIENGDVSIAPNDLRPLLALLGVRDMRRVGELLELARIARKRQRQAWYQEPKFRESLTVPLRRLIEYEAEAAAVYSHSVFHIPGLLQTSRYSSALMETWLDELDTEVVRNRVEARKRRRQAVLARTGSVRIVVLLDESVFRRPVGGANVFRDQLNDLLVQVGQGLLTVRMIPFHADIAMFYNGDFDILFLGDDGDLANAVMYRESGTVDEIIEDGPRHGPVSRHWHRFQQIWNAADTEEETLDFIRRRITELG